jgi:circadian clock protein KaiC
MASPEFAVADGVIVLETKRTAERSIRYISVRKLRGGDFLSGDHAYRLRAGGLNVFPRFADPHDGAGHVTSEDRASTGIPALDDALEDGYWRGSTTLIAGPTGAGKTLMGLHFLYAGAGRNEPGVLVTLQENRTQLARIVNRLGWSVDDPLVTLMDRSPVDIYIDEVVYELIDRVNATGARRVVIDSLNDLGAAAPDKTRFREFLYSLVQRCSRRGVSLMLTYETAELFRVTRLSDVDMSHIADNVVLLQHVPDGAHMKRALSVLKTRGSNNSTAVTEFVIGPDGITLGKPIAVHTLYQ